MKTILLTTGICLAMLGAYLLITEYTLENKLVYGVLPIVLGALFAGLGYRRMRAASRR